METVSTPIHNLKLIFNKVISDKRGVLAEMLPKGEKNPFLEGKKIGNIYASVAKGKFVARGGHYHFKTWENHFTLSGLAFWYFYDFGPSSSTKGKSFGVIVGEQIKPDLKTPEDIPVFLLPETMVNLRCGPEVYHIFWSLAAKDVIVLDVNHSPHDPKDYVRIRPERVPGAIESFQRIKDNFRLL